MYVRGRLRNIQVVCIVIDWGGGGLAMGYGHGGWDILTRASPDLRRQMESKD